MEAVQKIKCKLVTGAGFSATFVVSQGENATGPTSDFAVWSDRTIDLAGSTFPVGATVWPVISADLGKTIPASHQLSFALNGKTAVYEVWGTTLDPQIQFLQIEDGVPGPRPAGFPADIPVNALPYRNWDGTIAAAQIWTCAPHNADDAVAACNWAAKNGYTVRPRGIMHNWSPLTIAVGLPDLPNILLLDTTKSLNAMTMLPANGAAGPCVRVGTGATTGNLLHFLEQQPGGNGAASGFSVPHLPAPDHLTIGGVLAINGHGTAVRTPPNDDFPSTYGSMSNRILELTAVVTDPAGANPGTYTLKTFKRGDPETKAFLTQLGRALIVEVTLQVVDNFNLRCRSYTDLDKTVLFAPPKGSAPAPDSCADFLSQSGRIEIIWFPFTDKPWLKVWSVEPEKPASSIKVEQPNNYPFSDELSPGITALLKLITSIPGTAVELGGIMQKITNNALDGKGFSGKKGAYPVSRDIWGPSRNTLFYVKDTTLRVTANGYAILMNKANVQQGIADFTDKFESMLSDYRNQGKFPINSPLEIRVTGLDSPDHVPSMTGGPSERPVLSSLSTDAETVKNNWDVALWLDVLTLPGTRHADEFFTEMEAWFLDHYKAPQARVVPEWSKGWAFSNPGGAWKNAGFFDHVRKDFSQARSADDNWEWAASVWNKYDADKLFHSPLMADLLSVP